VNDTVSSVDPDDPEDDCGPTPHSAAIESGPAGRLLRLLSGDSQSSCADNIWVELRPLLPPPLQNAFQIPLLPGTSLSFRESGTLEDPRWGGHTCLVPPCGDTVSLELADERGNALSYVLQRASNHVPNPSYTTYREILLDPAGGSFTRDLFADFSTIPDFEPSACTRITSIVFAVNEHGSATLADLVVPEPGTLLSQLSALLALLALARGRRRRSGR
jgi:hypothetical protein